jgi:galactonate dehydratase
MKIDNVEAIAVDGGSRNWVFVRVTTDAGLVGVGEATLERRAASVLAAVEELSPLLIGADPRRIEHLWQKMYRGRRFRGGAVTMSAISGIEVALWDIKGKALGAPIYDLLGGACRDRIPIYANAPLGSSREELVEGSRGICAQGFDALKVSPIDSLLEVDDPRAIDDAVETVAAIRDAIGARTKLSLDLACRLSPAMAIQFATAVADHDIWFIEEPVRAENPEALAMVARATTIPIAAGEQLLTRWGFRELLRHHAVAMVQPDVAHCGGIGETRRVAAMAEVDYVGFAPHNPLSAVNTAASCHVAMATPNFVTLEYKLETSVPWLPDASVPWRDSIVAAPLEVDGCAIVLTEAPGLGIELDWDACLAHPAVDRQLVAAVHPDGAIAEY